MRGTRSRTSAFDSTMALTRIAPALSTVITRGLLSLGTTGSFLSGFGGKFNQNVLVTMGVTIMKMIRTTSTTSTKGVMLIEGNAVDFFFLPPPPRFMPMRVRSSSSCAVARLTGDLLGNHFEQHALEADVLELRQGGP